MTSTALLTDQYELTMISAARKAGTADRRCVFELFARRLPDGRRYGVVAGTGRFLDALEEFRFGDDEIAVLKDIVDADTLAWLADYRFSGDIDGYREGELYFPNSRSSPSRAGSPRPSSWRRWPSRSSTTTAPSPPLLPAWRVPPPAGR